MTLQFWWQFSFGKTSVLMIFQILWHFSFGDISILVTSVLVTFQLIIFQFQWCISFGYTGSVNFHKTIFPQKIFNKNFFLLKAVTKNHISPHFFSSPKNNFSQKKLFFLPVYLPTYTSTYETIMMVVTVVTTKSVWYKLTKLKNWKSEKTKKN